MNKRPVDYLFPEEYNMKAFGRCPRCRELVISANFRDSQSRAEFRISGYCQDCQDLIFGV